MIIAITHLFLWRFVDHTLNIGCLRLLLLIDGDVCTDIVPRAQFAHFILDLGHHCHIFRRWNAECLQGLCDFSDGQCEKHMNENIDLPELNCKLDSCFSDDTV